MSGEGAEQAEVALRNRHVERALGEERLDQREARRGHEAQQAPAPPASDRAGGSAAGAGAARRRSLPRGGPGLRRVQPCSTPPAAPPAPLRRDPLQPLPHPRGEDEEAEADGEVAEDEPPDEDVERGQLLRHVRRHDERRQHLGDAGGTGRRGEVEQEGDQRLKQQDVHEVRVDAERAHGDVARQQLVGVRRRGEERGPEQRQPAARGVERHDRLVGLVDAGRAVPRAARRRACCGGRPSRRAVDQRAHGLREDDDGDQHHAEHHEDRSGSRGRGRRARGRARRPS